MSTRSSIAYGNNFHLYNEVLDEDYVYLELEGVQFEAAYDRVMVPIPSIFGNISANFQVST